MFNPDSAELFERNSKISITLEKLHKFPISSFKNSKEFSKEVKSLSMFTKISKINKQYRKSWKKLVDKWTSQ
jgi:hypothetical protein